MRIVAIREKTVPIASPIANAYIDFSKMTCSVVAVVTDVGWVRTAVAAFGFIMPGHVMVFSDRELPKATRWLSE